MERPGADTPELAVCQPNSMCQLALRCLEYGDKTEERAQSGELEFDVPAPGLVVVTNVDHDSAHTINVADGVPVSCSCPADTYQSGACKHRVAVAMADPVLEAAVDRTNETRAMADGGTAVLAPETRGASPENTHVEGCDDHECEGIDGDADRPILSFECWSEWAAYSEEQLLEEGGDD